jgi:chemotaxis signal transduction protein
MNSLPSSSRRLAALAAESDGPLSGRGKGLPYLMLGVAGDVLAVPFLQVREVVAAAGLAVAPAAAPALAGTFERDGRTVPLFDLRVMLGAPAPVPAGRRCVVISAGHADWHQAPVAVLVDCVGPVVALAPGELGQVGDFGDARSDFLLGIGRVSGERRWLIDVDRLLPLVRPPGAARRG